MVNKIQWPYSYHFSNHPLPISSLVSDLGIRIDNALTFFQHISTITNKVKACCAIFLKTFIICDAKTMLFFYTTYVRRLLYCSPVWSPISAFNLNKLESVHRFFTNKIHGCTFLPYHQRLRKLSLHTYCK